MIGSDLADPTLRKDLAGREAPKVSIIVNCKNGAQTIRRCIEGVLAQTYHRVELVFQDGGSTDETPTIVDGYIKRHPDRIRLNHEPDTCSEEGLFRALKACEGDIIGSSMADEELLPEAAARAVEQFNRFPDAGAIYGDVYVTGQDGRITGTWVPGPFSLKAYLCREVDPPFAASFFRREALLEAGLLTRRWTWGIGEYELWLRVAMRYPIHYVPGVIAKYSFHPNTASFRGFLDDDAFVSSREAFFERFFMEPDVPDSVREMKEQALTGLHLFVGEVLRGLKAYDKAQKHLQKALERIPNGPRLVDLAQRLSRAGQEWDREMLRTHIRGHLAHLPGRKIVCYGAGNDFMEFIAAGVFEGHTVVAVVDNNRSKGTFVGGVPVVRETDLGLIAHDLVVVTSSKWAHELRTAATHRSIRNGPYIPVI